VNVDFSMEASGAKIEGRHGLEIDDPLAALRSGLIAQQSLRSAVCPRWLRLFLAVKNSLEQERCSVVSCVERRDGMDSRSDRRRPPPPQSLTAGPVQAIARTATICHQPKICTDSQLIRLTLLSFNSRILTIRLQGVIGWEWHRGQADAA